MNRLKCVNNTISYAWLNQSFDTYMVKCKKAFFILIQITKCKFDFLNIKLFYNEINVSNLFKAKNFYSA